VLTVYELVEGDGTTGNGRSSTNLDNKSASHFANEYRYSRHGHGRPTKSSQCPCQTKQGPNIWPGRLIRREILLSA
jgi:hypothetical protein